MAVILVVCSAAGSLRAEDSSRQLETIRTAWATVAKTDQWSNGRVKSVIRRAKPGGELMVEKERTRTLRSSPQGRLSDDEQSEYEDGKLTRRERVVILDNPEYSCQITDKKGGGQFLLTGPAVLHKGAEGHARIAGAHSSPRLRWLQPAETFTLSNLLDPALTQVLKVEETETEYTVAVRVRAGLPDAELDKVRGLAAATLVLNRRWSCRLERAEFESDPQSGSRSAYRLEYLETPGSEHLLRRMEIEATWQLKDDPSPRKAKSTVEFEDLPPPDDHGPFYLSHYGMPEPEGVTVPAKPIPLWVWLLAATGLFAGLAVLLTWLARRRANRLKTTPPPPG